MNKIAGRLVALCLLALLASCGGGDSTTTTIIDNSISVHVATPFVQAPNNLRVVVEDGPRDFQRLPNANILYATVTVCVPGGNPGNPTECQVIDHVQVDTGSVGLRILASKVKALNLPRIALSATGDPVTKNAYECFPFVIGGLWGANAGADVWLGQQVSTSLSVQLIEDDPNAALQATSDCVKAADNKVLTTAGALGSNGILGIGSTTLDCGLNCEAGDYTGSFVQYYSCPQTASGSAACSPTAISSAFQVYNPIAALPKDYNNGVVLKMPAVTDPGAGKASGELIFGINTLPNNTLPANAVKVFLGVDYVNRPDSYLYVTTVLNGRTFQSSYLDTGTNGLFFNDASQVLCADPAWYCPKTTFNASALLSDGDNPLLNQVSVAFHIANAVDLFDSGSTAFSGLAGSAPGGSASFAWGMPFFYGRQVFLSIWQQAGSLNGPWVAWVPI
jgi:hypothetical protein